jgi:hypothetical protein
MMSEHRCAKSPPSTRRYVTPFIFVRK